MASPASGESSVEDSKMLQAIRYTRGKLELLDQRKLPHESIYTNISDATAAWEAIYEMVVRGAPAIAIAAALALAVEVVNRPPFGSGPEALAHIQERLEYLVSSRPTAVNLADAAEKLGQVAADAASAGDSTPESIVMAYVHAAEAMLAADVASNRAIGDFGAEAILAQLQSQKTDGLRVLTHCNTGSLATAAYGTALGVIRSLHAQKKLETAICTETRPYNQGSRLTAYELVHDCIPAILIADSAAAALQRAGRVDAIVVGADRIAGNGDTANKIGTYSLALSAHHHGVPFYVAAPLTSTDVNIRSGAEIVIEERTPKELTHSLGGHGPQVAPHGIRVWNPAFDVTPARLITGIITDKGVIQKAAGANEFDIPAFISSSSSSSAGTPAPAPAPSPAPAPPSSTPPPPPPAVASSPSSATPAATTTAAASAATPAAPGAGEEAAPAGGRGFKALDESSLVEYVAGVPSLAERLGGSPQDWAAKEVGDGNVNFVYIVEGPRDSIILKQALPYIRCVGESWPMTLERAFFEAAALREHARLAPEHVPAVLHFDHPMALTAMEFVRPPHVILRKGLIAGQVYPLLARHMASYMARTLFHTSLLAHPIATHRAAVAKFCGNMELCRLSEQVIFTDPYHAAPINRWTSPQLDDDARALREDTGLKIAVASLKSKFSERAQGLLHGDLHTGSIMATPESTQVIDPEFAFYGPWGFDVGAFLGNLLLAFFSQEGHATPADSRQEYGEWVLKTLAETWTVFSEEVLQLWKASYAAGGSAGDAYPAAVFNSDEAVEAAHAAFMAGVFSDSLGFAGAKMIRRIVGIAHVEDMESIEDAEVRAKCERKALEFAKRLVKDTISFQSIDAVVEGAKTM